MKQEFLQAAPWNLEKNHAHNSSGQEKQYTRQTTNDHESVPLLVFSHLRWHFITQRPQHLLSRAAKLQKVFFWEEPLIHSPIDAPSHVIAGGSLELLAVRGEANVTVIRPHFFDGEDPIAGQRRLLGRFLSERNVTRFDRWYYTPMALSFSSHLEADVTIFDCMDELSAFLGAPPELIERERELFRTADVVFTGGRSIYEAKRCRHPNVHLFPSSIEVDHFAQARTIVDDPVDQRDIPHPRAGFFGVLDERFDISLVSETAALRPDTHFIFLGPVVKIDPATLPQAPNLHFLGMKTYDELPSYLAGWDIALLPFAINQSTRFISPTKTPEYLAAGKPVISTPIHDVVSDYGNAGLVEIASTPDEFVKALDRLMQGSPRPGWNGQVERKLASTSWDATWAAMRAEIKGIRLQKHAHEFELRAKQLVPRIIVTQASSSMAS